MGLKTRHELAAQYQGLIKNRLSHGRVQDYGILAQYGQNEANLENPSSEFHDQVRTELKQLSCQEISSIMARRKTHAKYLKAYEENFASERKQLIEILKERHKVFSGNRGLFLVTGFNFDKILDEETRKLLSEHSSKLTLLGRGNHGEVYHNSQENYNIKIPYEYRDDPESAAYFLREVDSLVDGQGLPCIKKLIAYSAKDTAIVTEFVDGQSYQDLDAKSLSSVTAKQLSDLIVTIEKMHDKGYSLDISSQDIFYSPDKGFTFIDNGIEPNRSKEMSMLFLLYIFFIQPLREAKSAPDLELMKNRTAVTKKLFELIKEKYPNFTKNIQREIEEKQREWARQGGLPNHDRNIFVVSSMPWIHKGPFFELHPSLKKDLESLAKLSEGIFFSN